MSGCAYHMLQRLSLSRVAMGVALGLVAYSGAAATPIKNTQAKQPIFVQKPGPPPGFTAAELNVKQTTYVSVYFLDDLIGNFVVTYDMSTVSFKNPQRLLKAIEPYLKKGAADQQLLAAIKQPHALNTDKVCTRQNPFCKPLTPQLLGVVFDEDSYRLAVFVNPNLIKPPSQIVHKLPPSDAGFSVLLENHFALSDTQDTQAYSLNNETIVGYGNNRLTQNWSFNHSQTAASTDAPGSESNTVAFNQASVARYQNGVLYQFGMLTPDTGDFISSQQMLGYEMRNYGIAPSLDTVKGSPVEVYLPLPAKVSVYRNNQLISAQSFNAGKHFLDTTSFPGGSYDVTLRITDNTGKTTTETRFFVKNGALPQDHPNYDFAVGVLQSNVGNFGDNTSFYYPRFTDIPYLNYYEMRKIANNWGLISNFNTNFNRAYLSGSLDYFNSWAQIQPGVMVSNNERYGSLLRVNYFGIDKFNLQYQLTKYYGNAATSSLQGNDNIRGSNFLPISTIDTASNLTLSYRLGQVNLNGGMLYTESQDGDISRQYNISMFTNLFQSSTMSVELNAQFTHSNDDNLVMVGLTYNFFNPTINGNVGVNTNNQVPSGDNGSSQRFGKFQKEVTAGLSKQFNWGSNNMLSLNATGGYSEQRKNVNLQAQYQSDYLNGQGSYSYTNFSSGSDGQVASTNKQYTLNLDSNIVYADGKVSFGYRQGLRSGVILDVKSDYPADVEVYADNTPITTVATNWPKAIFLQPYHTYRLTIEPKGTNSFSFDPDPKSVTLYLGNIEMVTWTLAKNYILFGKVVSPDGKPLRDLLLEAKHQFDTTDENGYIQAGVETTQKQLVFRSVDGDSCAIAIPKHHVNQFDQVVVLKQPLVCDLQKTDKPDQKDKS